MQVLSRRDLKALRPSVPYVVISIANPATPHPALPEAPLCRGVLRVAFDDVEATRRDYFGEKLPMTPNQAREIREFVEAHLEESELIVVHCDAGMCRSPAVAAALWRWLEQGRGPFFETFRPNPHVYRMMSEALFR